MEAIWMKKHPKHLYRFSCTTGDLKSKSWNEFIDHQVCDSCGDAILYLISTPDKYLLDWYAVLVEKSSPDQLINVECVPDESYEES